MLSKDIFGKNLLIELSMKNISSNFKGLEKLRINTPDKFSFYEKVLKLTHMNRSWLQIRYFKTDLTLTKMLVPNNGITAHLSSGTPKKDFYANLNENDVVDNKQFWKTAKHLLSDKGK